MGLTQKLGTIPLAVFTDSSNNVGIGGAANASFKLQVTGATNVTGVLTLGSTISNGTFTYTLPSATGTLALTSALSGYLPLTGGTLTGALSGTSATFSGSLTIGGAVGNKIELKDGAAWPTIRRNTSTGGIIIDTEGASIAGSVFSLKTLNGSDLLSITSGGAATFSADVTLSSAGTAFVLLNNTTPTTGKQWRLSSSSNGSFFITQPGVADVLTLAPSTGAATFSSSVTAGGFVSTQNDAILSSLGSISRHSVVGLTLRAVTASAFDFSIYNVVGDAIMSNPTGTKNINFNSGNVGIGNSAPLSGVGFGLQVTSPVGQAAYVRTNYTGFTGLDIIQGGDGTGYLYLRDNNDLRFGTNNTERMRITAAGSLLVKSTTSYPTYGAATHMIANSGANFTLLIENQAFSGNMYGEFIYWPNASPNNATSQFLNCFDSLANRLTIFSNGGIANYQANNVNLSDERTKKDIIALESYWDKFKAIEIVKFKYKDQTHDDFNIGVIAQQVEKVAPEFIDVDGWGKPELDEDGNEIVSDEEPLKSVYTADLHHATIKVLQEAMARIEQLEEKVKQLENK